MYRAQVLVCGGAGCISSGCRAVRQSLIKRLHRYGLDEEVQVVETGCMGPCGMGPMMMIYPEGVFYQQVKPEDMDQVVWQHLLKGRVVTRLVLRDNDGRARQTWGEIDFFNKQKRIALRNTGLIDPARVSEYIARDGYHALRRVLSHMEPGEVIKTIKDSGLRGRGGAGFPTGLKWELAARANGPIRYVVCNADEGDPGAFMDRSILEGDPHSVLEAMAIGGYAIGAAKGYIYIRAEYPLAVERLGQAIDQAYQYGLLGRNIFGSCFDFDLELRMGAGAFVCGEETALLASIEGHRGEPGPKPPFPANQGLYGNPTVINNVETWANIPPIVVNGADWFASIGTEKSKGTKVFALAGKINSTGLVEVPMGTELGTIVYDIAGGIPQGKRFKAAQTGGPSGGCLPREFLSIPMDYESLSKLGAIMGSGGLIIMDEDTCMVDMAKFFLEFIQDESCGKCSPCRIGTKRMLEILQRITRGQGRKGDIERLIELGENIKASSLCGLGQSAPNPVLSMIRHFRHEFEEHVKDKHCTASVCAPLFRSPCQNTCPAGIDVPLYIDLIKNNRPAEAYEAIRKDNPFPAVCGRVCHRPCESKCRRNQLDQPLAIRALKRYASDYMLTQGQMPVPPAKSRKQQKVSIIGSGPAGLTAAHYLARQGYGVTVYEALPVAGGMLAVGIPEYRLPRKALNAEIDAIRRQGVDIKTSVRVGQDISLADLQKEYKAIFIGIGAHEDQRLGIPGEDMVLSGITFLREINLGLEVDLKDRKVVIIGGGNVAADASRSALYRGAKSVSVYYRRTREEMSAMKEEVEEMEREGIALHFLAAPVEVIGGQGMKSVKLTRMQLGAFDRSGRRRAVPVEGSEFVVEAEVVIAAIGQSPGTAALGKALDINGRGTIKVNPDDLSTNIPGIFSGGDCVTGPDTVIGAIAAGKKAAAAIDRYLGGDGALNDPITLERRISGSIIEEETPRLECGPLGYTPVEALSEANRCLRCDVTE